MQEGNNPTFGSPASAPDFSLSTASLPAPETSSRKKFIIITIIAVALLAAAIIGAVIFFTNYFSISEGEVKNDDPGNVLLAEALESDTVGLENSRHANPPNPYLRKVQLIDSSGQVKTHFANWASTSSNGNFQSAAGRTAVQNNSSLTGGNIIALTPEQGADPSDTTDPSDENSGGTTDPGGGTLIPTADEKCFTGAKELGWIVCPVLNWLSDILASAYDNIVVSFLFIDAQLFEQDGTSIAWGVFQTLANIAFIIMLLVVIFSQITGVGIDNYGIKRILPKLIIAAVLINLSLIICRLAIDVSNILGYSLRQVFVTIGERIPLELTGDLTPPEGLNAATVTSVFALIVGVLAGSDAFFAAGPMILAPLLLGFISATVAVLFMFFLLGARQAGVVLLTVMSPLAIVCYMLPNTKKIFDRWRKMFTGLLLLFPICGLLMGGGELASRILLSANSDNFFTALIAMLIGVLPFFFIPTLLRGSFAAMGSIAGTVTGLGKQASRGLTGAVRGSNFYKDKQISSRAFGAKAGAAVASSAIGRNRIGKALFGRAGQQRGYARALAAADDLEGKDAAASSLLYEQANRGASLEKMSTDLKTAISSGDSSRIQAVAGAMKSVYGKDAGVKSVVSAMRATAQGYNGTKNEKNAVSAMKSLMGRDRDFEDGFGKERDLQNFIRESGADNGTLGGSSANGFKNLSDYTGSTVRSMDKTKDWATANGSFVKRAAASGELTQDMASQLLSSNDPAITSGLMSDSGNRSIISAIAGGASFRGLNAADDTDINSVNIASAQIEAAKENQARDTAKIDQAHGEALAMNQSIDRIAADAAAKNQEEVLRIRHDEQIVASRGKNGTGFYDIPDSSYTPVLTDTSGNTFKNPQGKIFDRTTGRIK